MLVMLPAAFSKDRLPAYKANDVASLLSSSFPGLRFDVEEGGCISYRLQPALQIDCYLPLHIIMFMASASVIRSALFHLGCVNLI